MFGASLPGVVDTELSPVKLCGGAVSAVGMGGGDPEAFFFLFCVTSLLGRRLWMCPQLDGGKERKYGNKVGVWQEDQSGARRFGRKDYKRCENLLIEVVYVVLDTVDFDVHRLCFFEQKDRGGADEQNGKENMVCKSPRRGVRLSVMTWNDRRSHIKTTASPRQ